MGCIAYDWTVDPLLPGRMHAFESWASEAALGAHLRHSSYRAMVDYLGVHELVGFDAHVYSVAGMETVLDEEGQPRDEIFGVKVA